MFNSMWFLICLCFSKGQLALLHKDQQIEAPQSNAKLEENTLSKIEEALVWLNQCITSAKKALGANSTGQTSNFMKAILKTKSGELISLQSKIQEIKIFGSGDLQQVKTLLASVGSCPLVKCYE